MKRVYFLAAVLCMIMLAAGCGKSKQVMSIPVLNEPQGDTSDVVAVKRQPICNMEYRDAQVIPYTEELSFSTNGVIEDIKVEQGQHVKKGDILATLVGATDNAVYDDITDSIDNAQKDNAESNLIMEYDISIMEAESNILDDKIKKASGKEKKQLKKEKQIKEADIVIEKQKLADQKELQNIELKELKHKKEKVQKDLQKYFLYADMDGIVTYISKSTGDQVSSEAFVLAVSSETRKQIKGEFISSSDLRKADKYYVKYKDKEYGITQLPYDAEEISQIIANEETAYVYYDLDEQNTEFEVGEYVNMCVESGFCSDALVIPINALYEESHTYYVYKKAGDTKVKTEVTIGTTTPSYVQITDGVGEGDEVYVQQ